MLVFGTQETIIANELPPHVVCPNCGQKGTVRIAVWSQHFHIVLLPIIHFEKQGTAICSSCHVKYDHFSMPVALKEKYLEMSRDAKVPIWKYSGVAVLMLLILFLGTYFWVSNRIQHTLLNNPQAGDMYYFKSEDDMYSAMRVDSVTYDSIYVIFNKYLVTKSDGIREIDVDRNYESESEAIYIEDLKAMYSDKTIYRVKRGLGAELKLYWEHLTGGD